MRPHDSKVVEHNADEMMTKAKVPIGIVMPLGVQQGGAEALFLHLLKHESRSHRFVCAFLEDGPLVREIREMGYSTTVFPTTKLKDLGNFTRTVASLRSWIIRNRLKMVFSWMPKAHLYVAPAAILLPVRTLWFQHGVSWKGTMDRLTTILPANAILCCSETSKRAQDQLFPKRRSEVCYPGVSFPVTEQVSTADARRRLALPQDIPIVGMVARWERWKGLHIFLEAAKSLAAADPKITFFIVGGPHPMDQAYAEELQSISVQENFGERLILAGQRPSSEVPLWHASADLIVHPVTGIEPFGMAVAEAMSMSRVVIASDLGGPSEIIENGVNGILIPKEDPAALTCAITELLNNSDLRRRLSVEAYKRGRSFSIDAFANRFDHLLTQFIE